MRLRVAIAVLAILISIACVVASVDVATDSPPRSLKTPGVSMGE